MKMEQTNNGDPGEHMSEKRPNIKRSAAIASALFLVDAFFLNQGLIALITVVIVLPVMIIRAVFKRKDKVTFKKRFVIIGIYFVMAALIFVSNNINNHLAKEHAKIVIGACEDYKIKYGVYPGKLPGLVPEFLDEIPPAKYTFFFNRFRYISLKDRHTLLFIAMPPFGRPYYVFEEKRWGYLD